jgi:hypothetical protein
VKKTISYFSAMALTLGQGGPLAFAQEEAQSDKPDWKKDFSVTIGTKVWLNEWQLDRFFSANAFDSYPLPLPNYLLLMIAYYLVLLLVLLLGIPHPAH